MPDKPFSPLNPAQPSDFMKNDIPAETDDLELGKRNPGDADRIENGASHPDSQQRRTGGSADDPHGGRH